MFSINYIGNNLRGNCIEGIERMAIKIISATYSGLEGQLIDVEVEGFHTSVLLDYQMLL